jgi:hypothetical protein
LEIVQGNGLNFNNKPEYVDEEEGSIGIDIVL